MYEKIVVATDGSSCGNRAVAAAADMAQKYDAQLNVVHVLMHGSPPESLRHMAEIEHLVDVHPDAGVALDNVPALAMSASQTAQAHVEHAVIEAIGTKVLQRAVDAAKDAGAKKVDGALLEGDAARKIVDATRDHNANLIVLGSRGLSSFKRLLVGSVSQKVSQMAECACLIVR
ncbi:MAG: universal stress protein [Rhodospirillaceae bacterium]|nr:universal stress protein [Rhodospirillaceae bacterium]